MIIREGMVLLEYSELVNPNCLTVAVYKHGVAGGSINAVQRSAPGKPALVEWSTLPEKYRELVKAHLKGDPEQLAKAQVIERHLVPDQTDEDHIDAFRAGNDMGLPAERRAQLKTAARIMSFLATVDAVMKEGSTAAVQLHYGMPVMQLKEAVLGYVKANKSRLPSKFPTSYARLEARKRAYLNCLANGEPGAASLIHGGHGNSNRDKVATEEQQQALRVIAARPQNYSLRTIASHYNQIAKNRDWPTVSANTVKRFLGEGENGRAVTMYAKGGSAYHNKYGVVVHRSRPTQPTYMWVHDGTDYELLFQRDVAGKRTYHHRKKVVVVVDPHTWYPVGYAIGDQDTIELSQAAVRNAVQHMRELTGQYAIPYQVQSDRLGHKTLGTWYDSMGVKFTPAAARNARAKVIEPWFGLHNDHYVNQHVNWSGHNITSKRENQPNPDALNLHKKSFPTEVGVIAQIHDTIAAHRADKVAEFKAALDAMPEGLLRTLNRERFLEHFGTVHPWTNELTNRGLCPTLLGEERPFQLLSKEFQRHVGKVFQVVYDPEDLSDVQAVTDEGRTRFLVPSMAPIPMALMDHTEETRANLAAIQAFKLGQSKDAIAQILQDKEALEQLSEMLLQDAIPRLKAKGAKTDDLVNMSPEEEAVTKAYLTEKGGHKAALHTAQTEAQRRANIEQWARENM